MGDAAASQLLGFAIGYVGMIGMVMVARLISWRALFRLLPARRQRKRDAASMQHAWLMYMSSMQSCRVSQSESDTDTH